MRLGLHPRHVVIGALALVATAYALSPPSAESARRQRIKAEQQRSTALQDLMTDEEQAAWRRYKARESQLPPSATADGHYQRAQRVYGLLP